MGPTRSCQLNGGADGNQPKTKKSPAAVRPPGGYYNLKNMSRSCRCPGGARLERLDHRAYPSRITISPLPTPWLRSRALPDAMSADLNRCYHPKNSRLGKRSDAGVVIAERLAQHFLCMLAQQGRGYGIDDRRQAEMDRRFDIRDRARGRVRNLA